MVYEDYKIYGPYRRKDGRQHVLGVHLSDKSRITVSYPKYLVEINMNRYLGPNETVDHIDCDFQNNELTNLRVLDRRHHCREDSKRLKLEPVSFICPICKVTFILSGTKLRSLYRDQTRKALTKAGPFCSKSCVGLYGAKVQNGKMKTLPADKLNRTYSTLKSERLRRNT